MIPALSGTLPAGVRVLIAGRPVDFRRVPIAWLRHRVRVSLEAGGPGEDTGL
jgi:hypothetical protein